MLQRLFTPRAGSSNPHPSTMCRPSSLTSPTATIASFAGMQVKICFFLFLSFHSFLTNITDSLSHMPGPQTPPLHHIIPTPVLFPQASQVLPPPLPAFTGTQVKISSFLLFFISFLTNVTETLFTPHTGSSNPFLSTI